MADNKAQETLDPEAKIQTVIGDAENFLMKNGRTLLIALIVISVAVGGFFGYKYFIAAPRAEKAAAMMFVAEQHFATDSLALALNGDGTDAGFLEVIERYGSTPEGNMARQYAGICYLRLGEYEKALDILKKFDAVQGIPGALVNAQNIGLQGDVYVQLKDYRQAASLYEKAVKSSENALTVPYYLKKLGGVYEQQGEYAKALEAYKTIRVDFASSMEARDIQKSIGRLEQMQ